MKTRILSALLVVFCFGLFTTPEVKAQSIDDKTWMSFYLGHNEFKGDRMNELGKFDLLRDMGAGVSLHRYLNDSFDANLSTFISRVDNEYQDTFSRYMINGNLTAQYKFANGYVFEKNSAVQPFLLAGVGYTYFKEGTGPNELSPTSTFQVPLGAGVDIPLSDNVEVTAKSVFNKTFNDQIDGLQSNNATDNGFFHTIGIKLRLGKVSDTDNDGIRDSRDDCPTVAGDYATNGCADRDQDMIIDSKDRCPNQAGLAKFQGCPDTDSDGLPNYEDQCPNIPGSAAMNGCADTDSDGISDKFDECATVAGPERTKGCPDADSDAIIDSNDACPNVAGVASNDGCPVVAAEIEKEVNLLFNNIYFATDEATLHSTSTEALNRLVEILEEDTALMLTVAGHADSRDTKEYNKELSVDRANAVKNYLTEKGIDGDRITTKGYGETKPIASNESADGKSRNRRVELTLSYN